MATLGFVADPAEAQTTKVRDRVFGDAFTVDWSAGNWTLGGSPVPGCETFPDGTSTGPGNTSDADSILCSQTPNGWHWTVTIPGPYTIHWDSDQFPTGVELCVQIFYSSVHGTLDAHADLAHDWLIVQRTRDQVVLYEGPLSSFDPEAEGFVLTEARRCGRVTLLPTGACCNLATGECVLLTQEECAQQTWPSEYQGDGTVCDPNPCVPPVPVQGVSWGRIKSVYR